MKKIISDEQKKIAEEIAEMMNNLTAEQRQFIGGLITGMQIASDSKKGGAA